MDTDKEELKRPLMKKFQLKETTTYKTKTLITKIKFIVKNYQVLIKNFNEWGYRRGPDLYFYKKLMSIVKNANLERIIGTKDFLEIAYATLVSWDMNCRRAKMKYFEEFYENIINNKQFFIELSSYRLEKLSKEEINEIAEKLSEIYDNLNIMHSGGKLVANSKIMHFLLPRLVMPMDRGNTLKFFYNDSSESKRRFLEIFRCSWYIANHIDLKRYLDDDWNQAIPKIIDNIILEASKEQKSK